MTSKAAIIRFLAAQQETAGSPLSATTPLPTPAERVRTIEAAERELEAAGGLTMAKLPAFQFYPGDWQKDAGLRLCSICARALHRVSPNGIDAQTHGDDVLTGAFVQSLLAGGLLS